jgi:hypothetical protein
MGALMTGTLQHGAKRPESKLNRVGLQFPHLSSDKNITIETRYSQQQ